MAQQLFDAQIIEGKRTDNVSYEMRLMILTGDDCPEPVKNVSDGK